MSRMTSTNIEPDQNFREFHSDCLDFVYGFISPKPLLESMANLNSFENQLTMAKATTTNHLLRLDANNPCLHLRTFIKATLEFFLTYTNRSFLLLCFTDAIYSEWQLGCATREKQNATSEPISLKRFILNKIENKRIRNSKLISYIQPGARTAHGRLDQALFIKDSSIRAKAIQWRANRLMFKQFCTHCMVNSNRAHVNTCSGLISSGLISNFRVTMSPPGRSKPNYEERLLDATISLLSWIFFSILLNLLFSSKFSIL